MAGASCRRLSLIGLLAIATRILMTMSGEYYYFVSATSFKVVNYCGNTLGVQVRENDGGPSIGTTGFSLGPQASRSLSAPSGWSGNFATAATASLLAEFTIDSGGIDFYDVSAVDGFMLNVGLSIMPGDGAGVSCSGAASICPPKDVSGNACVNPNIDDANTSYAQNVRASCPAVYSWPEDGRATYDTATGKTFTITFCPDSCLLVPSWQSWFPMSGTPCIALL